MVKFYAVYWGVIVCRAIAVAGTAIVIWEAITARS
jgi:hypothetical protein